MRNNKKLIISIGIVLTIIIAVSSITYAIFKWRSIYGLNVDIAVTDNIIVTFNGGTNISGTLIPTLDPSPYAPSSYEGIIKEISIKSNLPTDGSFSLFLTPTTLPNDLKIEEFKWMLLDCNIKELDQDYCGMKVSEHGDFTTSSMSDYDDGNGNLVLIDNMEIPFRETLKLYLYIWLDGTNDNEPRLTNEQISFDLYATGSNEGSFVELPSQ